MALTESRKAILGELIADIEADLLTDEEIEEEVDNLASEWRVPASEIEAFLNS